MGSQKCVDQAVLCQFVFVEGNPRVRRDPHKQEEVTEEVQLVITISPSLFGAVSEFCLVVTAQKPLIEPIN